MNKVESDLQMEIDRQFWAIKALEARCKWQEEMLERVANHCRLMKRDDVATVFEVQFLADLEKGPPK